MPQPRRIPGCPRDRCSLVPALPARARSPARTLTLRNPRPARAAPPRARSRPGSCVSLDEPLPEHWGVAAALTVVSVWLVVSPSRAMLVPTPGKTWHCSAGHRRASCSKSLSACSTSTEWCRAQAAMRRSPAPMLMPARRARSPRSHASSQTASVIGRSGSTFWYFRRTFRSRSDRAPAHNSRRTCGHQAAVPAVSNASTLALTAESPRVRIWCTQHDVSTSLTGRAS